MNKNQCEITLKLLCGHNYLDRVCKHYTFGNEAGRCDYCSWDQDEDDACHNRQAILEKLQEEVKLYKRFIKEENS